MRTLLKKIVPEWRVDEVETADEALALVKKDAPDVVLLDEDFGFDPATSEMRKVGTDATREMRAAVLNERKGTRGVGHRRMLIVGCTGYESGAHRRAALAAGQDHVIGKPYQEAAIKKVILAWFFEKMPGPAEAGGNAGEFPWF